MPTRLRPLGRRVILRKIEAGSRGGISLPKSIESEEHTQEYEVVSVPPLPIDSQKPVGRMELIDPWTMAEQLGIDNFGKPPAWATDVVKRLAAARLMGLMPPVSAGAVVADALEVGNRVYLARHKGYKIDRDGEELYVADVDDLLAFEEEEEGA